MDRRELRRRAREARPAAGVYQIRNLRDGRVLVASTLNLKTMNGARMTLAHGQHRNLALQADVAVLGVDAFVFEVLEVLDEPEDGLLYRRDALERLEAEWLARLRPWGERGYHAAPGASRAG